MNAIRRLVYSQPRPAVGPYGSGPNPWRNLRGGFSSALMRHAVASKTYFSIALLVEWQASGR
jgi:hypothetical protein